MDHIDLDGLKTKRRFTKELERLRQFANGVLGQEKNQIIAPKDLDVRNYAKYLLKAGTRAEKRELLTYLKSSLRLRDKELLLA